jgi:uncharacterized membrane protein (DUF106 family)
LESLRYHNLPKLALFCHNQLNETKTHPTMTASEIVNIVTTVAIAQCVCDLMARWLFFSGNAYKRAVDNLSRAQVKRDKLVKNCDILAKQEKQAKKLKANEEECAEAASGLAIRHMYPKFMTSIVFLILYRILATEYYGKVIAVLPFEPFSLLRRLTQRGLDIPKDNLQACGFLFIYILSTLSVKYFTNKLVAVAPPKAAARGFMSVLDGPKNQRFLKSLGVDTDMLKME